MSRIYFALLEANEHRIGVRRDCGFDLFGVCLSIILRFVLRRVVALTCSSSLLIWRLGHLVSFKLQLSLNSFNYVVKVMVLDLEPGNRSQRCNFENSYVIYYAL